MTVSIGDLNVSKKVKRIYVGVDGKARRVVKVYARAKISSSGTRSGPVYRDTSRLVINSRFSFGNVTPVVCRAFWSEDEGAYLVSGTFKQSNMLSQIKVSVAGEATDNARDILLSDSVSDYTNPAPVEGGSVMLFSGALSKKIFVKLIDTETNTEYKATETSVSSFSFSSEYAVSSSPQHGTWNYSYEIPGDPHFVAANEYGDKLVFTYSANGGSGKSFVYSYKTKARSVTPARYDRVGKMWIAIDSSDGSIKEFVSAGYYYNNTGAFANKLAILSTPVLLSSGSYSSDGLYFGPSAQTDAMNSSGGRELTIFASTLCYFNKEKNTRVCEFILDYGDYGYDSSGALVFNHAIKRYSEQHVLSDADTESNDYIWRFLGHDRNNRQYVLSTLGGQIKIIKFSTDGGVITKLAEYDTGISISKNTKLQDTVTNYFYYGGRVNLGAVPAFVLTHNNEYNELVIVPPEIIV